jgi:hypothetical protein
MNIIQSIQSSMTCTLETKDAFLPAADETVS